MTAIKQHQIWEETISPGNETRCFKVMNVSGDGVEVLDEDQQHRSRFPLGRKLDARIILGNPKKYRLIAEPK